MHIVCFDVDPRHTPQLARLADEDGIEQLWYPVSLEVLYMSDRVIHETLDLEPDDTAYDTALTMAADCIVRSWPSVSAVAISVDATHCLSSLKHFGNYTVHAGRREAPRRCSLVLSSIARYYPDAPFYVVYEDAAGREDFAKILAQLEQQYALRSR